MAEGNLASWIKCEIIPNEGVSGTEPLDIRSMALECLIHEDIFSPTMYGSLTLADSLNLIGNTPIMGGEKLNLSFVNKSIKDLGEDSPDTIIQRTFIVYAIEDRRLNNDRQQFYTLKFISPEAYIDNEVSLSKSYEGTTDEIVNKIFTEIFVDNNISRFDGGDPSPLSIADTPHLTKLKYISNFWTPFQNFGYLAKRTKGGTLFGSDWFFYESNKGFYFTSLQALIQAQKDDPWATLVYNPTAGSGSSENPAFPRTITEMKVPRTIDILENQDSGYLASSVRAYDLMAKKMEEKEIDIRENWGNFIHTDEGVPVPAGVGRTPFLKQTFKVLNAVPYNDFEYNHKLYVDNELTRDNYINSFNNYRFELEMPGRTDIEAGCMFTLDYPSMKEKIVGMGPDEVIDPVLSGNYLITAVKHRITPMNYINQVEFVKNGIAAGSMGDEE